MLSAWALTAVFGTSDQHGRDLADRAAVAGTVLSRPQPTTRWRRAAGADDPELRYSAFEQFGGEDGDGEPAVLATARHGAKRL